MSNAALISQRAAGLPGNPFAEADARAAAAIAAGEGWVRISLLKHTADLFQAAARVSRALQDK